MGLTVAEILDHIFTTHNPQTGSLPPADVAWVVFAHGTVFCWSTPNDELPIEASFDALATAARAALTELGPAYVGSEKADFEVSRLDNWFPDEPVWWVTYDHPNISTIVVTNQTPMYAGLTGRRQRDLDVAEQAVILVRRSNGTTRISE